MAEKDVTEMINSMSDADALVSLAKFAEVSERYEDMAKAMNRATVLKNGVLRDNERNLLSTAYKNVVGVRRSTWRVLSSVEQKETDDFQKSLVSSYLEKVSEELAKKSKEVLKLLQDYLVKKESESSPDERVFYLKMKGDYYRYLVEVTKEGESRENYDQSAFEAYSAAFDIAEKKLHATDANRLGLALNFSVFYYEIRNKPGEACKIAKQAFDQAIADLESLPEYDYKDSTLVMQLLRDNLTLWTSSQDNEEDAREEQE